MWLSLYSLFVGLWVGLFLRWTEYSQNMEEARDEIWNIKKEHRDRIGPDQNNHTTSIHCETFTPLENLMDELTILWPHSGKDILKLISHSSKSDQ